MAASERTTRSCVPFGIVAALTLLVGAGRLAQLERDEGPALRAEARKSSTVEVAIQAQRGGILDTMGRVLAGSVRRPSVFVDPAFVSDVRQAAHIVAPVLGMDAGELERMLTENRTRRFMWVKRFISDKQHAALEALRKIKPLRGFVIRHEPRRIYPDGRLAAHVIGFVDAEQIGRAGIEQWFNGRLEGKAGKRVVTVDRARNRIEPRRDAYRAPHDGDSILLTIDAYIQGRAELRVKEAVAKFDAHWGTAVVMDPHTGEILACVSYPDFDPARPIPPGLSSAEHEAARARLMNRAVAGAYEPGSVFKPFVASCAVDEGFSQYDEIYEVNGPAHAFGRRIIHDDHTWSRLTLEEVISKSSNIGMGMLADRLGNRRLYDYVQRFGFGSATGVRLPAEAQGTLHPLSRWTSYSTQSIPIGQEIAVTSVQLISAFSVFCNGGMLYRARVVRGVIDAEGRVVVDYSEPIAVRRVLSERAAREIRLGPLVQVVTCGTGRGRVELEEYQVLGKTGTAQLAYPHKRGYIPGRYFSSFIGAAPSDNPRVVVLVSLYYTKSYGGSGSGPAAAKILSETLKYLRVPPQYSIAAAAVSVGRTR